MRLARLPRNLYLSAAPATKSACAGFATRRASIAKLLHLSRNLHLSRRMRCACHEIYTSGCHSVAPRNLIPNPQSAPLYLSLPQRRAFHAKLPLSRRCPGSAPFPSLFRARRPSGVRRRDRGSFETPTPTEGHHLSRVLFTRHTPTHVFILSALSCSYLRVRLPLIGVRNKE